MPGKLALLDLAIGTVKVPVPYQAKGKPWTIAARTVGINPGQSAKDAERFAAALVASYSAFAKREAARPHGDGLESLANGKRRKPRPTAGYTGKRLPTMRVDRLPPSKLHQHSARCIVPMIERVEYPERVAREVAGWYRCKLVPYPFLPLHEHRTKRGRAFLTSHLPGIKCPFDVPAVA